MKPVEFNFCMKQFKPAIAALSVLVVAVIAWTGWHCTERRARAMDLSLAAATAPMAPPISVKAKMTHPYWGNCSKCHVTIDAGKPISKVMAGAPISINDKMPHKYWGNCLLCHKVTDGLQPQQQGLPQAKAAAANRLTARSLGLSVQSVTGAMMRQFGLASEDGVLVLDVAHNSIAATAGIQKGDEIVRTGKTRVETTQEFDAALNKSKPGSRVKIGVYRGKKNRNLFVTLPGQLDAGVTPAAATAPMTRNQIETLAEQLGVPKTRQDVARALEQQQGRPAAVLNSGKVAVAAAGPGLGYPVSHQFGASPYFVVWDPGQNNYGVVANPNANDAAGRGIQTGHYVVDLGVSSVVAGSFSQNALHTLHTLRVNVYSGVTGSVGDVLSAFTAGQLTPANTDPRVWAASPGQNVSPGAGMQKVQTIY